MNSRSATATRTKFEELAPGTAHASCPACGQMTEEAALERLNSASLYACARCDLHFWHPVSMPCAAWYETAYQGRDQTAMQLEPGHRFFLYDSKAPKSGRLLDLGCGVGNFLAAARDAGFDVAGIELNQNAVRFAQQHYGLRDVTASRPGEFLAAHPGEKFGVVTFFEVLEHQADPQAFLNIAKDFLMDGGFLALSVPNRSRWKKGIETLDYPPNHLTRWSPCALRNFLERNGFEVLTMRQEPLGILRAAQVLSSGLRTGLVARVAGEEPPVLSELAEMKLAQMKQTMERVTNHPRHRLAAQLVKWKNFVLVPVAGLLLPFLRLRGYTGLYLYCLARRNNPVKNEASTVRVGV